MSSGKIPLANDKLIICVKGIMKAWYVNLTIHGVIKSQPGLDIYRLLIMVSTSSSPTGEINIVCKFRSLIYIDTEI